MSFRLSQKAFLWRTTVKYLIAGLILAVSYVSGLERLSSTSSEGLGAIRDSLSKEDAPAPLMDDDLRWLLNDFSHEIGGHELEPIFEREEGRTGSSQDPVKSHVPGLDRLAQTKSGSTSPAISAVPQNRELTGTEASSDMSTNYHPSPNWFVGHITHQSTDTRTQAPSHRRQLQATSWDVNDIERNHWDPMSASTLPAPSAFIPPHGFNRVKTTHSQDSPSLTQIEHYSWKSSLASTLPAPNAFIPPHLSNKAETANFENSPSFKATDISPAQSSLSYEEVQPRMGNMIPHSARKKGLENPIESTMSWTQVPNTHPYSDQQALDTNRVYHHVSGVTGKSDDLDSRSTISTLRAAPEFPRGEPALPVAQSKRKSKCCGNPDRVLEKQAKSTKRRIKLGNEESESSRVDSNSIDNPNAQQNDDKNKLIIDFTEKFMNVIQNTKTTDQSLKLEKSDPVFRYAIPLFSWKRKTGQDFAPLPSTRMTSRVTQFREFLSQLETKLLSIEMYNRNVAFREEILGRIEVSMYNFIYVIILMYRNFHDVEIPETIEHYLELASRWIMKNWKALEFEKVRDPTRSKKKPTSGNSRFQICAYTHLEQGEEAKIEQMIFAVWLMVDWLCKSERKLWQIWDRNLPRNSRLYRIAEDGRYDTQGARILIKTLQLVSKTCTDPNVV